MALSQTARRWHAGTVPADAAERALASGLVQPDPTTCGSCTLVVSRLLNDPAYAAFLVDGTTGTTALSGASASGDVHDRFAQESLAMHRKTSGVRDGGGHLQIPWPSSLGTRPWALAREMGHGAGAPGTSYSALPILPNKRADAFRRLRGLAASGKASPLYVGNRWSPRHVVLVLPGETPDGEVRIYDPASGRRYPITEKDFTSGGLSVAGWKVPWVMVVPR